MASYDLSAPIGYLRTLIVLANRHFQESEAKMTELTRSIGKALSTPDDGTLNSNSIVGRRHAHSSSGGGDKQQKERCGRRLFNTEK